MCVQVARGPEESWRERMIEINGMAHVILTVSNWEKARAFYGELLPFLGLTKVYDGNNFLYHVGGRTAVGIQRCSPEHEGLPFDQNRVGLHHFCLRARTREDVDKVAEKVRSIGGRIDRGPLEGDWAPGYYFFVFEDPDGIRLEVNFIPGKGLLASNPPISPSSDPDWDQNAGPPRF
jgi:catechol 2,3-dioxygenase-like lactoylglutathione lyase family enzyme